MTGVPVALDRFWRSIREGAVSCLKATDMPLSKGVSALPVAYL
jgi:hypothetical protein